MLKKFSKLTSNQFSISNLLPKINSNYLFGHIKRGFSKTPLDQTCSKEAQNWDKICDSLENNLMQGDEARHDSEDDIVNCCGIIGRRDMMRTRIPNITHRYNL